MRTNARALVPIYGVTLIDVLGTMIMVPLLPYLAQHFGANGLTVGGIVTTSAVAGTVAAPVWGSLAGRVRDARARGGLAVTQSYIADVTGERDRDRAYAVFGLGIVLGPVLGGSLIRYGFPVPFAAAAVIEAITIGLTLCFLPSATGAGRARASVARPM